MDLRVTYHIAGSDARDTAERARDIALEQTVELAADAVPPAIADRIVGRVESVEPLAHGRWRAVIAFSPVVVGGDLPQLLDRKSTRLNSSHSQISYAVFCLKKKKKKE